MLERALIERCPLCGELHRRPWLYGLGFELVRCTGCGHRYGTSVHPRVSTQRDDARDHWLEQQRFAEYMRLLDATACLADSARVLQVGCQGGELLELFARRGYGVCGVEASSSLAYRARERLAAQVWQGRPTSCLPQHERFQLIVLSHVLDHTHEPAALLRRMRTALGEGGRLIVEVPNANDRLLGLWRGAYRPLRPGERVSFFDAPHLQQLLQRQGFVVERMVAPTHARDIVYPCAASALDAARAVLGKTRPHDALDVSQRKGGCSRWLRQLRAAVDMLVSAIDPAVVKASRSQSSSLRGPSLIALARPVAQLVSKPAG
jgi:SAM-dependent methyltransferase